MLLARGDLPKLEKYKLRLMEQKKLIGVLFCLIFPFLVLLLSYSITLSLLPLTPAQHNTIAYLQGKEELTVKYVPLELSHLQDVQKVMKYANYLFYALLLLAAWCIIYTKRDKEQLQRLLKYGGISTVAVIGLFFLGLLLSFNTIFAAFHQIFFPQGNWQFPADSVLIQTFPLEFFVTISLSIFGLSLGLGMGMFILSKFLIQKPR